MNQRLEKEIFDFLTTQSVLQDERSNVRERLGLYDELTVQKCAEYFYNLALEDVRKEIERRKIIYDDAEHETPYESVTPRQVYNARKSCMGEIILFIDRLSK